MTPTDLARLRAVWETHPPIEDCCNIGAPWLVALVNAAPELLAAAERCAQYEDDYESPPQWLPCATTDPHQVPVDVLLWRDDWGDEIVIGVACGQNCYKFPHEEGFQATADTAGLFWRHLPNPPRGNGT